MKLPAFRWSNPRWRLRNEWGSAYARQAQADVDAWDQPARITPSAVPKNYTSCKWPVKSLAKAHLCKAGSRPGDMQGSHAYIAANLPVILRNQLQLINAKPAVVRNIVRFAKRLARELELLSPAVDDGGRRPDNCEYPWEDAAKRLWIRRINKFFANQLLFEPHGPNCTQTDSSGHSPTGDLTVFLWIVTKCRCTELDVDSPTFPILGKQPPQRGHRSARDRPTPNPSPTRARSSAAAANPRSTALPKGQEASAACDCSPTR